MPKIVAWSCITVFDYVSTLQEGYIFRVLLDTTIQNSVANRIAGSFFPFPLRPLIKTDVFYIEKVINNIYVFLAINFFPNGVVRFKSNVVGAPDYYFIFIV